MLTHLEESKNIFFFFLSAQWPDQMLNRTNVSMVGALVGGVVLPSSVWAEHQLQQAYWTKLTASLTHTEIKLIQF